MNWNNFFGAWYVPSPGQKVYNNRQVTPDSGYGSHDWLFAGRLGAHTLWSEDWFADDDAQRWSFLADTLRSGAALGGQGPGGFGGYVVGRAIGDLQAGASYKILSLVGHGAKQLDLYSYGPEALFPGNCWSDKTAAYGPLAQALGIVRRGERLLFPGLPERGQVALHLPAGSAVWDDGPAPRFYALDVERIHRALVHAGHSMDVVDDRDLEEGALSARGYTTLYLSGPNLSRRAQEGVAAWVQGGGTLAVGPGAAVADQYNTVSAILDPVLGLRARAALRDSTASPATPEVRWLASSDGRFGGVQGDGRVGGAQVGDGRVGGAQGAAPPGEALAVFGPYPPPLVPDGAAVAATMSALGGGPAQPGITVHRYGLGTAIAYGFLPGWQYARTPEKLPGRLPLSWGAGQRRLISAPADLADRPRSVQVDQPGVEALRLRSAAGVAVVLLNWTDQPIAALTVTVRGAGQGGVRFSQVSALNGGPVGSVASADGAGGPVITARLALRDLDVPDAGARAIGARSRAGRWCYKATLAWLEAEQELGPGRLRVAGTPFKAVRFAKGSQRAHIAGQCSNRPWRACVCSVRQLWLSPSRLLATSPWQNGPPQPSQSQPRQQQNQPRQNQPGAPAAGQVPVVKLNFAAAVSRSPAAQPDGAGGYPGDQPGAGHRARGALGGVPDLDREPVVYQAGQ